MEQTKGDFKNDKISKTLQKLDEFLSEEDESAFSRDD